MSHEGEARPVAAGRASVTHPQRSGKKAIGTSDDRPETACRPVAASRELLASALLWACAFLTIFAILAARTQPTLAFLAMVGVVTLIVVRDVVRS